MNDLHAPRFDFLAGRLHEFFHAEMPDPWPVLSVPEPRQQAPKVVCPWWKPTGRFAVAASVGLILAGYLALASGFPRSTGPGQAGGLDRVSGDIANRPSLHHLMPAPFHKNLIRTRTPDGRPVLIEEIQGIDGRLFLKAQFECKENR